MRFVIAALVLWSSLASANYVMDPQRKPDAAFAKFFLNRVDSWFRKNLFDYRAALSKTDLAFIDGYLSDPRTLGEVKGAGFIRTYSYTFKAENGKIMYGPFRFVRPSPTEADHEAFARVLAARRIAVPKDVIGLGFTTQANEIEVMTLSGGAETVSLYRAGRLVGTSTIERGVTVPAPCPVSPMNEQVDRVRDAEGEHFAFHSSMTEDEAFSMEGRRLIQKVQVGLELSPGVIDYHSQLRYGLAYP